MIDFPATPTLNQVFAASNGATYQWNGTVWVPVGVGGSVITMSDTPPALPSPGQQWFNTVLGQTFIWYDDGTSAQWVPTNPVPIGGPDGDFYATGNGLPTPIGSFAVWVPPTITTGNSGAWYNPANGRYTPPAGRYCIFAHGFFGNANAAYMYIFKNGATTPASTSTTVGANGGELSVSALFDANGTDFFDVRGQSTSGAATSFVGFGAFPVRGIKGDPGPAGPSGAGAIRQMQSVQTGALLSGTGIFSNDNTIPQITGGNEFMTLAFTPQDAASILYIDVTMHLSGPSSVMIAALFRDAVAAALAASTSTITGNAQANVRFTHKMVAGGTAPITFRARAGASGAGTTTFNGTSAAGRMGGTMASSIVITEVAP